MTETPAMSQDNFVRNTDTVQRAPADFSSDESALAYAYGELDKLVEAMRYSLRKQIVGWPGDDRELNTYEALRHLLRNMSFGHAAHVEGDDVTRLGFEGALTANAYLGAWGIAECLTAGADVVVTGRVTDASLVVGPAAPLAALVASGLPPYPFTFAGFPPPKSGKRRNFFKQWADLGHTLILFESPHRLIASLEDALAELGDRPVAVGRELTKLHEEILRGRLSEVLEELRGRPALKGEFVLVVGAAPAP